MTADFIACQMSSCLCQDYNGGSISQVTRHRSRVTGHGSRVTGHGSQVTGHRSRVTGHGSQVTGRGSQIYEYVNTRYVEFIVTISVYIFSVGSQALPPCGYCWRPFVGSGGF